jgi:hypothetical protein
MFLSLLAQLRRNPTSSSSPVIRVGDDEMAFE